MLDKLSENIERHMKSNIERSDNQTAVYVLKTFLRLRCNEKNWLPTFSTHHMTLCVLVHNHTYFSHPKNEIITPKIPQF